MTFKMLATNPVHRRHFSRIRVWLADRLVLDVERDGHHDDHVVQTFDDAAWAGVLLGALIIDEDATRAPRSDH
jgi:hypothetical protein